MPVEFEYIDDENEEDDEEELDEDDEDMDVIESIVNDAEIDEMINVLKELKATKESVAIQLDEETELVFHHEDGLEEEDTEEEEE